MTVTVRRPSPLFLFATVAALVYAVELAVVRSSAFSARPGVVGPAVALDLAIVVPALYWLLVLRRGAGSWLGFFAVLTLAWAVAPMVLPGPQRHCLAALLVLAPLAEAVSLGYAATRLRRVVRAYRGWRGDALDVAARLRSALTSTLGDQPFWRAISDELAMWRYAIVPPRPPREGEWQGGRAAAPIFTYHRRSAWGAVVFAIALVGVVETAGTHLLVALWSSRAAWFFTASSAYAVLWLIADVRACARRPLALLDDALLVRVGLRWTVRVPYDVIAALAPVQSAAAPARRTPGYLRATPFGQPSLLVELSRDLTAEGPYGIRRLVRRIGLAADDPARLAAALEARRAAYTR